MYIYICIYIYFYWGCDCLQNCLVAIDTGRAVRTNDAMRESMMSQSGSGKCKDLLFQEESTSPIKVSKSSEKNKSSSQR